jgi:hypothetical protein
VILYHGGDAGTYASPASLLTPRLYLRCADVYIIYEEGGGREQVK